MFFSLTLAMHRSRSMIAESGSFRSRISRLALSTMSSMIWLEASRLSAATIWPTRFFRIRRVPSAESSLTTIFWKYPSRELSFSIVFLNSS